MASNIIMRSITSLLRKQKYHADGVSISLKTSRNAYLLTAEDGVVIEKAYMEINPYRLFGV